MEGQSARMNDRSPRHRVERCDALCTTTGLETLTALGILNGDLVDMSQPGRCQCGDVLHL